mmetsp:Transcript_56083/g.147491  ORF Transcript_56083/g.147491 Transcript_56083/m.147491 type:complete len:222 (+) Transcript_56083:1517-2182(+)
MKFVVTCTWHEVHTMSWGSPLCRLSETPCRAQYFCCTGVTCKTLPGCRSPRFLPANRSPHFGVEGAPSFSSSAIEKSSLIAALTLCDADTFVGELAFVGDTTACSGSGSICASGSGEVPVRGVVCAFRSFGSTPAKVVHFSHPCLCMVSRRMPGRLRSAFSGSHCKIRPAGSIVSSSVDFSASLQRHLCQKTITTEVQMGSFAQQSLISFRSCTLSAQSLK